MNPTPSPGALQLTMTEETKYPFALWGIFPGPIEDKYNAEIEACRVARLAREAKAKAEGASAQAAEELHYSKRGATKLKDLPKEELAGQTFAGTLLVTGRGRTAKAIFGWTFKCTECGGRGTLTTGELKKKIGCSTCRSRLKLRRTRTSDATNGKEEPSHGSKEESREENRGQEDRESGSSEEVGEEAVG